MREVTVLAWVSTLQPLQMTYNICHGFEHCILLLPNAHLIHQDLFDLGNTLLEHEVRLHFEVHCNYFLHGGRVVLLDCEGDLLVVHLAHVLLKQLVAVSLLCSAEGMCDQPRLTNLLRGQPSLPFFSYGGCGTQQVQLTLALDLGLKMFTQGCDHSFKLLEHCLTSPGQTDL